MKRLELNEEEASRSSLKPGDLLFARRSLVSEGAGKCSIIMKVDECTTFESSIIRARPDPNKVDSLFLYYLFNSPYGRYLLGTIRRQVAVAGITGRDLAQLEILLPPLAAQRAIAHTLGSLDDKIELNRRMNDTLEAITQAIFKSWFVDFDPVIDNSLRAGNPIPSALAEKAASRRELLSCAKTNGRFAGLSKHIGDLFPDRIVDSELGEIPHGWDIKAIGDVAERVAMGPFGSSIKVETFVHGGVPIISGQHLRGFMLEDNTFNFITYEHAERLGNAIVQRGDVVFTHAGNIGQAAFIPNTSCYERYVISQRQFYLRCDLSRVSPTYITLFFSSHRGRNLLLANSSSSGVPSIARPVTYLRSIRLLIPQKVVLDEFEKLLKPILLLYRQNKETNLTLVALRDMLLPKLVSGALRVKDSEDYVRGFV